MPRCGGIQQRLSGALAGGRRSGTEIPARYHATSGPGGFVTEVHPSAWGMLMVIKVARVPYLSHEPFYFDMKRRGIELYDMVPSALAAAAEKGEIDAGPVSLVDCFRLEDHFRPLAGFCLATIARARSVNLYSKQPIQELTGARIGVTGEAATSARLLQVLLSLKHQVQPAAYVSPEDPHEALLLIGNQGLRRRGGVRGFPHKYDLGEEWHQWTGLPFVFARWMVRKDMDPTDEAVLQDALYVGLQDWADGLYRLSDSRDSVLMHPQDILEFINGIRYFIGVPEQRAIDLFQKHLQQLSTE
jgi:chorismate dehydratase